MNIRCFDESDTKELKKIHEKFFKSEFSFPDFTKGFTCAFTVYDAYGIIASGGIKPILEAIVMTNKDRGIKDKREGLYNLMQACNYITKVEGYNQMHAFVQDRKWLRHLVKVGFNPTKGQALVLDLED